jgi:hypothetical protein
MGRQNTADTTQPSSDQAAEIVVKRGPGLLEQTKEIALAIIAADPKAEMGSPRTGRAGERVLGEPKPDIECGLLGL